MHAEYGEALLTLGAVLIVVGLAVVVGVVLLVRRARKGGGR